MTKELRKNLEQLGILLAHLYLDLDLNPDIENKHISKLEDGAAKKFALSLFRELKKFRKP